MDLLSSWNKVTHDVEDRYEKTINMISARIDKFELDNHIKNPPVHPKLPYIQLHDGQLDQVLAKPGNYSETIKVDGRERHFILHVPQGYDPSARGAAIPLIVALHGFTQSAAEFEDFADMDKDADKRNAAILYPDATKWLGIDIAAAWDTGNGLVPPGAHADDIGFLRKVIGVAETQIKVDRNRIDFLGVSNGGMMAYKAATELSDIVAAVVDISGAMSGQEKRPKNPVSVMTVVGTKDDIVPPDGRTQTQEVTAVSKIFSELVSDAVSQRWKHFVASDRGKDLGTFIVEKSNYAPTFKPVSYATDFWKKADGISGKPLETKNANGSITVDYYQNPGTGVAVEQVELKGMDHAAQNGVPAGYKLNDEAWAFLSAHPKYHRPVSAPERPRQKNTGNRYRIISTKDSKVRE